MFCNFCGAEIPDDATICSQCKNDPHGEYIQQIKTVKPEFARSKSRLLAALLQIFLGCVGAGRFYLGYNSTAVLQLFLTFITGGTAIIWPIIDGILILIGKVPADAAGIPLQW